MSNLQVSNQVFDEREGAEIVYGAEECYKHSLELLEELGFPKGVLPLKDLVECGRVRATGFVWMKQKAPYQHFFTKSNTLVKYESEVTAYVGKGKMTKMTGTKSKQMLLWVPIVEMSMVDEDVAPSKKKIYFKTPMGIGRAFPVTAFMTEEENQKYLKN
ncbi:OLC1v1028906C1 [Oldenlandia corymbosa var. corymbosa]|uniref:OLC1v1028906C1 n=1 Tax=Oldenlandia corymbosa var. corymbosa TaxID=529605 RepID=A0AAV1CE65_OLDCO|nr:OLC1v1028906C1 [Oldenlandia corymbosa var. corymbosa]